jgi:hypothetical protein
MFMFFFKGYHHIKIELTFSTPKGTSPTLEEFNEFLHSLNKLHEHIILNTQPEYLGSGNTIQSQLLDWHKLEVIHICRKNPFDVELCFRLLNEGIASYWTMLKAFIFFCKRYGRNVNELEMNIEALRSYFYQKHEEIIEESPGSISTNDSSNYEEKLFSTLMKRFMKLLTNKGFRITYDKFCNASIAITNLVSFLSASGKIEKFIDDNDA